MQNFKKAHHNMIFGQLLPNKLLCPRLMHAFEEVWREDFLPDTLKALAYSDQGVPLSKTRSILSPLSFMRLVQAAQISRKENVLHIAANTGYGSVILSYLAKNITALEEETILYKQLNQNIENTSARTIETYHGKLSEGVSTKGPYDVILIEGASDTVPSPLFDQLKDKGRLLGFEPLSQEANIHLARAFHYQKIEKTYTKTYLFETEAPLLPLRTKHDHFHL